MSLNIGTLAAYLSLDDSNFTRKADQADRKLSALQLHLDALDKTNPKISVEVRAQTEKIDEIKAKITALRADMAKGIDVKVEMTQAMIELDRVQTKIRELHNKTIKVDVDNKDALAKLDAVEKKTQASSAGLGALGTGVLALGPALVPITGAIAGLSLALATPLVTAGGGLTLFGLLAGKQITNTNTVATQLKALEKSAQTATSASSRNKAVSQYTALYKTLSASQLQFIANEQKLRSAFGGLTTDQSMFGPINKGVEILTSILPKLRPLLDATGHALDIVLGKVQSAVKSGEFDKFIAGFSKLAGPSIVLGLDALGQFGKGLIGLGAAFGPLGIQFLTGLDHMATSFAKWGANSSQNQGVQAFIAYVQKQGPVVADTLGHIVVALVHIGVAMAPWGDTVLRMLDMLAKIISAIPTSALTPLVTGLLGVNIALKAMKAGSLLTSFGDGLATIMGFAGRSDGALASLGAGISGVGTRLSTSKVAMGAFGAGLAGLIVSSTSASTAVNVFGDTASGALLGLGITGTPVGAAVGGLVGFLGGSLISALKGSENAFRAAKADVQAWADAINQGNQAAADFAKQQLLTDLNKRPELIQAAKDAGLSLPQLSKMVQAGTLSGLTSSKISGLEAQRATLVAQRPGRALRGALPDPAITAIDSEIAHYKHLQQAADQFTKDSLSAQQQAWIDLQLASTGYQKALARLPKQVQTRIDALNIQPTEQQVIDLAARYNVVPKDVQTYLHTLGVDASIKDIQKLITAAKVAQSVIGTINSVTSNIVGSLFGSGKHARGGLIVGPGSGTSDSIPAMLSNGEFVVNAKATAMFGPVLQAMNAKHFAAGGLAGVPTPGQLAASLSPLPSKARKSKIRKVAGQSVSSIDSRALATITAALSKTASQLSAAHSWASSIAGNPFSANLVGPASRLTTRVGGVPVSIMNAGQAITPTSSNAQVLAAMMAYQAGQYKTGHQLMSDIQVLRKKGVSNAVLAQMQSAGAQGVQEIHALASAPAATVRKFNQVQANITATLDNAGAFATSGQSYSSLQKQQLNQMTVEKGVKNAIKNGVPVVVVGGSAHPQIRQI